MSQVHPLARTTPRTRAEIKASLFSITALSKPYTIIITTARKWKHRDDVPDCSHRPLNRNTTLTPAQEARVVEVRRNLLLITG